MEDSTTRAVRNAACSAGAWTHVVIWEFLNLCASFVMANFFRCFLCEAVTPLGSEHRCASCGAEDGVVVNKMSDTEEAAVRANTSPQGSSRQITGGGSGAAGWQKYLRRG